MTIANIPTLITKLQAHLAALGDGRDARSENERATYRRTYSDIQRVISSLMNEPHDLAAEQARIDEWQARRVAYLAKEAEIEKQIADAPDWQTMTDARARARDKEIERQRQLTRQLQLLRDGTLLVAPGVTYGDLDTIDARIAELRKRCDALRSALDAHLKAAEQLLAATVTG
jgi:hypothetical protein